MSSKMASTVCQKVLKKIKNVFVCLFFCLFLFFCFLFCFCFFCQKAQHFVKFGPYDFVQISLTCGTNILTSFVRNVWRDLRLPMSALATVARKSFNGKFTAKIDFQIGHFMLPSLMLTLKVCKSLHTLFDKYLDHMLMKFEQNRMVRNIQIFQLFGKKGLLFLTKRQRHF